MIAPTYSPEQHRRAKHSKTGMYITRKIFLYSICAIYSIGGTYSLKRQFVRTGVHTSHHILRYDAIGSKIWRSSGERGRRRSWIFSQAKKRDPKVSHVPGIPFFSSSRENHATVRSDFYPSALVRFTTSQRGPCGPVGGPGGPRATMKPRHLSQRRFLCF